MPDIFENLSESINDKQGKSEGENAETPKATTSGNKSESKTKDSSRTTKGDHGKTKESSSNSSSNKFDKSIDKLAKIMSTGFSEMKDMFMERNQTDNEYDYEDLEFEEFEEQRFDNNEQDLFDDISGEINYGDSVGPEVRGSLANLCNKMLQLKISEPVIKEKRESYIRPKNVQFLNTPKVNKPIWENLATYTRIRESQLQGIHTDFLGAAVPVIRVMEKVFECREDTSTLDPKEIIDVLKDSLMFLGSANLAMIKTRRENIKKDIPKHMHGICREDIEFSSNFLFGDHLNSSIKEVSELNKISSSFKTRGFRNSRGMRRGFQPRNRGRISKRGNYTRGSSYKSPYPPKRNDDKKNLNSQGPSKQ